MKIAMLTNNYKPFVGGVPISIERLSDGLRQQGHEVYIFAPTYKNQVEEEYVIRYKSYKKKLGQEMIIPNALDSSIEEKIKALDIDIIHVHHPMLVGWIGLYLGKKYNIPVVYTYHTRYEQYLHYIKLLNKIETIATKEKKETSSVFASHILKQIKERWVPTYLKQYSNHCTTVFAPTQLMQTTLQEIGVTTQIEVLPTGIKEQFFHQDRLKIEKIRKQYIADKKYLFCTVSRLSKEKNITFLIDGLRQLKKQEGDCFRTLIIGDGPLKESLKQQVKALDLENNIIFLNSIDNEEIAAYYGASDLFLFASKSETQGIVLLEAMASSTCVVAVKASGVVEVVKNDINGYMTEENIKEWTEKIIYLINNPIQRGRLSKGALETAKNYSTTKVAIQAMNAYTKAIDSYRHSINVPNNDKYKEYAPSVMH